MLLKLIGYTVFITISIPLFAEDAPANLVDGYWQQMMDPTLSYVRNQQQQAAEQQKLNQQQQERSQQLFEQTVNNVQQHIQEQQAQQQGGAENEPVFQPKPPVDAGTKNPWLKTNQWQGSSKNPYPGQQYSPQPEPKSPPQEQPNIFAPGPPPTLTPTGVQPEKPKPKSTNIFQ